MKVNNIVSVVNEKVFSMISLIMYSYPLPCQLVQHIMTAYVRELVGRDNLAFTQRLFSPEWRGRGHLVMMPQRI